MDKIKIIREALESIEGAWIDAVPLEKINKALQALAELEQPTVNEDTDQLIHLLDAKLNKFIMLCTTSNRYNSHDLEFILQEFKKSLSQVKPSVWKKYPDEKPTDETAILALKADGRLYHRYFENKPNLGRRGVVAGLEGEPWFDEGFTHWCYEADLIKTIKE